MATEITTTDSSALASTILHPETTPAPTFTFTPFLHRNLPTLGQPSKAARPLCPDYKASSGTHCPRGASCPDRHFIPHAERHGPSNLICKHYQRGLCKRPDTCEYAHTFNLRDERECKEFARWGICPAADDCTYLHLGPQAPVRRPACPHYTRGFCALGPHCAMRHVKHARVCGFYLAGFCPNGRSHPPDGDKVVTCEFGAHARWIADADLHPKVPKAWSREDVERETKEQEAREEEYYAEAEELRRRQDRGEIPRGRWGGQRGRRPGRGFRRN